MTSFYQGVNTWLAGVRAVVGGNRKVVGCRIKELGALREPGDPASFSCQGHNAEELFRVWLVLWTWQRAQAPGVSGEGEGELPRLWAAS